MTYPFVELYGRATDQPSAWFRSYLEGAELPKTDLGLEYTIQTGSFWSRSQTMDKAKIPHTPFTVELLPLANMPFALEQAERCSC
jgi:hypothetical protein